MVDTKQWLVNKTPHGPIQLSGPEATFKQTTLSLPTPKPGQLLVKAAYLSNDPAQRRWIAPTPDPARSYTSPVVEGDVMRARALGQVQEGSQGSKFKVGDWVLATSGWSEFAVVEEKDVQGAPDLPGGLGRTHYLGGLGTTGLTAWCGLVEVVNATKDDIVVISGAAGATGSMAVQIAKKIIGCKKVIGIAGTDEKCKWVESLGADVCLNYKAASFANDLEKVTPSPEGFATVYFDNVGGEILDLMLTRIAQGGRVAACGSISNYDVAADKMVGIKNWFQIISMRIQVRGFIVLDYITKWPEAVEKMRKAVADGKLKVEGGETVVKTKWEDIPKTWMKLFDGSNTGKLVTELV